MARGGKWQAGDSSAFPLPSQNPPPLTLLNHKPTCGDIAKHQNLPHPSIQQIIISSDAIVLLRGCSHVTGRYQNTNGQNTNDHYTNLIGILIGSVGILIGSVGILIGSVGILIGSVGILNIFRTALFVVGIMKFRLVFWYPQLVFWMLINRSLVFWMLLDCSLVFWYPQLVFWMLMNRSLVFWMLLDSSLVHILMCIGMLIRSCHCECVLVIYDLVRKVVRKTPVSEYVLRVGRLGHPHFC